MRISCIVLPMGDSVQRDRGLHLKGRGSVGRCVDEPAKAQSARSSWDWKELFGGDRAEIRGIGGPRLGSLSHAPPHLPWVASP